MKNILVKLHAPLRHLFPSIQKLRGWALKFHNRTGIRLVSCGGRVRFLDTELNFGEGIGLNYSTPLFWNGPDAFEAATSRTIGLLAGKSRLFLDVGSNIGIYSVYVGVKFPKVKILAFEPVPSIWEKNRAFRGTNNLSEDVVQNLALSDQNGRQKIYMPVYVNAAEEEQIATLRPDSWQAHEEKVETFEIQCVTLDTFAENNPLPDGLCTLKIDAEKFESAVLRGGKRFIISRRPWIVCEILHCEEFDAATKTERNNNRETLALVEELNYTPFTITQDGFFRMTAADFARPRGLKEFLLAPSEKVPQDTFYLALSSLAELLPQT